MRNVKLILFVVVFVAGWLGGFTTAHATVISSVVRGGTSTNDPPIIAPNPLAEDELSFVDRTHQYNNVPIDLLGAEYVMVANNDKTQADYSLQVTLSQAARLYLFLDNRLGHGAIPGGDPFLHPDLHSAGMDWVYTMGFSDTGDNIGIDEDEDGKVNQWASVYSIDVCRASVIVLSWQNDTTNAADRNMYGIAAKSIPLPSFWPPGDGGGFIVVDGPDWISIPWGFYGGGDWFNDDGLWRQPFEDPPIGGPDFWAFTDWLTFRYGDKRLRRVDRSPFFWGSGGQGNCLHLLADPDGPYGPSRPLHPDFMANFEIKSHTFSVNAGKVQGQFEPMQFIQTGQLEEYARGLGMTEADIQVFMDGDIFGQLRITDPLGEGYVGVEHAQWIHPEPALICTAESLEITEGEQVSYGVALREEPNNTVTINVVSSLPDCLEILGADPASGILQLQFDQQNWDVLQSISVRSIVGPTPPPVPLGYPTPTTPPNSIVGETAGMHEGEIWEGEPPVRFVMLFHFPLPDPCDLFLPDPCDPIILLISVLDAKTGGQGYLAPDINRDAHVNFKDVAEVAAKWLESTRAGDGVPWIGPWQSQAIGTSGGSASYDDVNEVWSINGDGKDIGGTSDQFHYVYQKMPDGDFQMTTTVLSLGPTDVWAKAGVMLRGGLDPGHPGSPHVSIFVTPARGVAFQWRPGQGEETQSIHFGPAAHLKPPISLRLVKTGNTVTGLYYVDGEWVEQASIAGVIGDPGNPPFIGMAVTSHAEGKLCTATFGKELVSLGPQPEPPE